MIKIINYWLKEIKDGSLFRLADALDEIIGDQAGTEKYVCNQVQSVLLNIPILTSEVAEISNIIRNLDTEKIKELKNKLDVFPKLICCFTSYCCHRGEYDSDSIEDILKCWVK